MTSPAPILEVRRVSKVFGGVRAIQDASLDVGAGEIVALIGPNGAGKTTLFNTVTGLIAPTCGEIVFRRGPDKAPVSLAGRRPDRVTALGIGRTFQNIRLFPKLSALENVMLGAHCQGRSGLLSAILRLPPTRREERHLEALALSRLQFTGLADVAQEAAGSLPYGHQRRLEIARALANRPSLLLLDEPAAGMNPSETDDLIALIRQIREMGVTVFLIEHDMKLVMQISDRVFVLDHGEVICCGPPETVQNDPRVIEAYLGAGAVAH